MSNPLEPLAAALRAVREWSPPLQWLANQVLERCWCLRAPGTSHVCARCYGVGHSDDCTRCHGSGWTSYNPVTLHWIEGWEQTLIDGVIKIATSHTFLFEPDWVFDLRIRRGTPLPALARAVQAIAKEAKRD